MIRAVGFHEGDGRRTLRGVCERQPRLLTRNDCEHPVPYKNYGAFRRLAAFIHWFEAALDSLCGWVFDSLPPLWRDFVERNLDSATAANTFASDDLAKV